MRSLAAVSDIAYLCPEADDEEGADYSVEQGHTSKSMPIYKYS